MMTREHTALREKKENREGVLKNACGCNVGVANQDKKCDDFIVVK